MDSLDCSDLSCIALLFFGLIAVRWIHFAAVYVLFGAAFFWFAIGPQFSVVADSQPRALRATTILLRCAAPIAALSGAAWIGAILALMVPDYSDLLDPAIWRLFFLQTPFGVAASARLFLLIFAVVFALTPQRDRLWFSILQSIAALLLIDQAWLGHAAEDGGVYGLSVIAVYSLHVLATAAWVGGLVVLLFVLNEHGAASWSQRRATSLSLFARFSGMAMVAVFLAIVSGLANAGFRVGGSFNKFFASNYGDILLAKLSLMAAMLILAVLNRFILLPRLTRASADAPTTKGALRASLIMELILGALVLAAAALLGATAPPH